MTVLQNTAIDPDDVAAYWLDRVEEMVYDQVDYDGNPIEGEIEYGGGSVTVGNRRVRVVGAWSEVVFQWFSLDTPRVEGDFRFPLTFDGDETVDSLGTTVEDLLYEAVDYLEDWRADVDWYSFDDELWAAVGGQEVVEVNGEGLCYEDADGTVWSWTIDPERGNADVVAGAYSPETGEVDWTEYGSVEGVNILQLGMAKAVEEAVADVRERLGE